MLRLSLMSTVWHPCELLCLLKKLILIHLREEPEIKSGFVWQQIKGQWLVFCLKEFVPSISIASEMSEQVSSIKWF